MESLPEIVVARQRSLGRVARTLAHDVRGASNAIVLHTAVLRRLVANLDDAGARDRAERALAVVEQERARLQALAEAILAHAHVGPAEATAFDLSAVVAEVAPLLEAAARARRVTFAVERPGLPVGARADRELVRQALLDAGLAALEASPARMTLTVVRTPAGASVTLTAPGGEEPAEAALAPWRNALAASGQVVGTPPGLGLVFPVDEKGSPGA